MGAWEMGSEFRALVYSARGPLCYPAPTQWLTVYNSSPMEPNPLFWPSQMLPTYGSQTYTQSRPSYTSNKSIEKWKKEIQRNEIILGWWDGSTDKGSCHQPWQPKLKPQDPNSRIRKPTLRSWTPSSTYHHGTHMAKCACMCTHVRASTRTHTHIFAKDHLPHHDQFDFIPVMGQHTQINKCTISQREITWSS